MSSTRSRSDPNSGLRQGITVIDVDSYENWIPLYMATYSTYMRDKVIRVDLTERGYHLILMGKYPSVQLLFGADMNKNAPRRLFIIKFDGRRKRKHRVFFDLEDVRRVLESF